jgi:hypothetical protein
VCISGAIKEDGNDDHCKASAHNKDSQKDEIGGETPFPIDGDNARADGHNDDFLGWIGFFGIDVVCISGLTCNDSFDIVGHINVNFVWHHVGRISICTHFSDSF